MSGRSVFRILTLVVVMLRAIATGAAPGDAVEAARALLAAWHEDPARIDHARARLEAASGVEATAETLVELSRAWFLTGDFRAHADGERVAAYERGASAARRAIAADPRDDRARLWAAINTGRLAELRGVVRAVALVSTLREESEMVLRLNPSSVDGLILAGGLAAAVPGFMGGDRTRAERLFKRALSADPRQTGGRLELARLYVATRRWSDAWRELQRIVDERAPTDLPRWTMSDLPSARAMLAELSQRGRVSGSSPESP